MMQRLAILLLLPLVLAACVEDNRYPVTNEECTADDPVLDTDVGDCADILGGTGAL